MSDYWRTVLARCQRRFEEIAARNALVDIRLFHAAQGTPSPQPAELDPTHLRFFFGRPHGPGQWRTVTVGGDDEEGVNLFMATSREAGAALRLAASVLPVGLVDAEFLGGFFDSQECWVLALFDMAWSGRIPGLPTPVRYTGGKVGSVETRVPLEFVAAMRNSPELSHFVADIPDPPTWFRSGIEDGAGLSAAVIAWVLYAVPSQPEAHALGAGEAQNSAPASLEVIV